MPTPPVVNPNRRREECHQRGLIMNVGDIARRSRTISRHDIELFTELTGDRNPLHYDDQVAQATRFGGIIVQGGVTTGLLNAVVAEDLPGPGSVFLHTDWSFRGPVYPDDTITAEVEVLELRVDKPISRVRTSITNQHGTVVVDGTAVIWTESISANASSTTATPASSTV